MKAVRLHHYGEHPTVEEVAEPELTHPLDRRRLRWLRRVLGQLHTLVLGLQHNWFLVPATAVTRTVVATGLTTAGGVIVLVFAAPGAYIWLSAADVSLGGPGYPLGKPLRP